ncbi:hypothetical protein KGQ20_45680 [Catenulispora sp. NF23]|uniref:DUF2269 domain-containing protein n=1 Tax=Catenulispora pinistramenti TaxID=2705254 RepID=A0ABS5KQ52_9ACTN|nr:hypothetical protein [Catenulispora pinistramenti]MBS2540055.1 hypothetical protein [Catenulispora pinistramenti]MBS2548164.1 hypothetical protein [Catenulispora pinistramenti]
MKKDTVLPRLGSRARKALVCVHVAVSVSWLGMTLCLLAMAVTALLTNDADTVRAAYRAMKILGDTLVIPLSLAALLSGLWLSLATPWRLFSWRWVTVKFWLTLAAAAASIFALRARLDQAAHVAATHPVGTIAQMHLGSLRSSMVIIPSVATCVYLANVAISVTKPWGRK